MTRHTHKQKSNMSVTLLCRNRA